MHPTITKLLLAIGVLSTCGQVLAETEAPRDATLRRAVIGKWCLSEDGSKSCWGYNVLRADGTFSSSGVHPETQRPFHIEGTFEAKGRQTCFLAIRNDSELNPKAGESMCSTILSVEQGRQVFRQYGDDTVRTIYRVKDGAAP